MQILAFFFVYCIYNSLPPRAMCSIVCVFYIPTDQEDGNLLFLVSSAPTPS